MNDSPTTYRRAAVAGQFYPDAPDVLEAAVDGYLDAATVEAAPNRVAALIAPHAGYPYSGPTAGFAYARARGMKPQRVILLGNSHRYQLDTASIVTAGAFETPMGDLQVDAPFAAKLAVHLESTSAEPHVLEHALEVHLPFVRRVFGDVPIVPVLFGAHAGEWHTKAGETLAAISGPMDLLIASTDLSHYHEQHEANTLDARSLDALLTMDVDAYIDHVANGACLMCGSSAVVAAMAYAKACGAEDWKLLDYRTSGEASGDYNSVVGYAAVSMECAA